MKKLTLTIIVMITACTLFVACGKKDLQTTKDNTFTSNGCIMRAVGEIEEVNVDDKGDYIVVSVDDKNVKFYFQNTTSYVLDGKASDKTMLKVGDNVEVLYAGLSSDPKDEYNASKITGNYSEDEEDTTSSLSNSATI